MTCDDRRFGDERAAADDLVVDGEGRVPRMLLVGDFGASVDEVGVFSTSPQNRVAPSKSATSETRFAAEICE